MTPDEIRIEHEKCKNDILYFLDNYVTPKIELTEMQRAMLKMAAELGPNDILFKPRPWGTKTLNQVLGGWREFVSERIQ